MNFNYDKPIIAVTGSAGKTMVKTMISAILREKWVIFESKDYYNTFQHTREHVKKISFIHRAAVLEYGIGYPGNLTEHCKAIQPTMGIITNIGLAHVGNFQGKVELLAAAKSELIKGMNPNGTLFTNKDDEYSILLDTSDFKGKIVTIGIKTESDYQAKEIKYSETGTTFTVTLDGNKYAISIPVLGYHNISNALFAIAVCHQLGFLPLEIQTGLKNIKKPNHRLDVRRLKDDITVIDDTVHANPPAMKAAIDVLADLSGKKKIAILGTMTRLAPHSKKYHEEIGRYVTSHNIDYLYTYGGFSRNYDVGAIAAGHPQEKVKHFEVEKIEEFYQDLVQTIEPGTIILVKGASGLNMYDIVRYLCKHYRIK